MSERQRQTQFLASLMRFGENESCRELQERLHKADADEQVVRRKMFCFILLAGISCLGFGYTAVFSHEEFNRAGSSLIKLFSTVGLASLLCLLVCACWWCWHRMLVNGLQEEGRHLVKSLLNSQLRQERGADFVAAPATSSHETSHLTVLPKTVSATNEARVEEKDAHLAA